MKRIVLAAITCLSLLVALPAVSVAHSSGHHDRERRDRLEHFRAHPAGTAGAVQSFQKDVLTITLPDGSIAAGTVTRDTRVSCEAMDRDSSSHDGGSGHGGSGSGSGSGSGDNDGRGENGDRHDYGDRHDENNDPSCVALLQRPRTTIRDAELSVSRGFAIWREIELGT